MPKITKAQAGDQELVVVRSRNTNKIERVIIPSDTQIGLENFRDGDLTVLGRLNSKGPLIITGGARGALNLPSGAPTLQAGSNITVTYNAGGTVTIAGAAGGTLTDGDKGDITVSGAGAVWTIDNGTITNAKLATMSTARIKGRSAAGTGTPEDLTGTQVTALLDTFTTAVKGLVPAPGSATGLYLKDDATWDAPASSNYSFNEPVSFAPAGPTFVATLAYTPSPSSTLMLFMNGQLLTQGISADYVLSVATITLNFAGGVVGSEFFATYQR